MIKILGSIIIIFACGMAGLIIAQNYNRRPQELRCLQSALQMLETEISYAASPLAEALKLVAERCDRHIAKLFKHAESELLSTPGHTAREAWEQAINKFYSRSALNASDLSILRSLGGTLGISDREDQIKHLRLARAQLKEEMENAQEEAGRSVKMWNYFGFFGGMVIVLILF